MNPRFYDRLAAAVSIGLLLMLAAGSYYLAEIAQRFVMPGLVQDTTDIADAFGENVLLLRLNDRPGAERGGGDDDCRDLLPVHDGAMANYRRANIKFVCVQLNLDFAALVTLRPPGNTIL